MNKTITLRGESNAQQLWSFLRANWRAMADAGKPLAVSITEAKSKRTLSQNSRHWAVMQEIADAAWIDGRQFSKEAWHEHMCDLFAPKKEVTLPTGEVRLVRISSSDMNVEEFSAFMQRIDVFAAQELGLELS